MKKKHRAANTVKAARRLRRRERAAVARAMVNVNKQRLAVRKRLRAWHRIALYENRRRDVFAVQPRP